MDGFITNGHWDTRGVMGLGPPGFHRVHDESGRPSVRLPQYVALHRPDPETGKAGYFLVSLDGIPMERSLPKSIMPNGAGAY